MPKFRYIGDRDRGDCLGLEFPRGELVEVNDDAKATKLRGNPHFQEANRATSPKPASAPAPVSNKRSNPSNEGLGNGDEGKDQNAGAD